MSVYAVLHDILMKFDIDVKFVLRNFAAVPYKMHAAELFFLFSVCLTANISQWNLDKAA